MKSVIMIANCFPPEGNAGTFRPLRFVRHLPSHGWQPTVIADKPDHYERYDPGLLNLVPPDVEVLRVRNPDPWKAFQERRVRRFQKSLTSKSPEMVASVFAAQEGRVRSMLRSAVHKLESVVYHPDPAMFWIRAATAATVKACSRSGASVIWATGGPWSSLVVGQNASRQTGVPYVLDLRDSWTLSYDEVQKRQPAWARARDRRLLSVLFRGAQAVVIRYMAEAESYWRAYPGVMDPKRIHLIPNGYDGSIMPFDVQKGQRCTVLYTGGVDTYIYKPLVEAVAQLKKTDSAIASQLHMIFVGEQTELIAKMAADLNLTDVIETTGPIPFSEVSRVQGTAHALLLLGWKPAPGAEFGGSKIFGYLKAGRPILGILPQDENNRILRSVGVTTIADANSIPQIIHVLRRLVDTWASGELPSLLPDPQSCEAYSAVNQTNALVRALEGSPALNPFVPGACDVAPSLERFLQCG